MAVRQFVQQKADDRDRNLIFAHLHSLPAPDRHTVADLIQALRAPPNIDRPSCALPSPGQWQALAEILIAGMPASLTKPLDHAEVAALELGRCCMETLLRFPSIESGGLDHKRFFDHSLAVGCIAMRLASAVESFPLGTAFLAGLLHDIGKAALDAAFPKSYQRVLQDTRRTTRTDTEAELDIFGVDHAEVGARLAQRWRLPGEVVEAILHHGQSAGRSSGLSKPALHDLVTFADAVAYSADFGLSAHVPIGLADAIRRHWRIPDATFEAVTKGLASIIQAAWTLGCGRSSAIDDPHRLKVHSRLLANPVPVRSGPAQPHNPSRCVQLVTQFCESLRPTDTVLDVCLALAETLETVAVRDRFVVWGLDQQQTLMYAAGSGPSGIMSQIRPVDPPPEAGVSDVHWTDLLRRHWLGFSAADRCRHFECRRGPARLGGLMFETTGPVMNIDPETCQLLSQALTLALAEARTREESLLQTHRQLDQRRRDESEHGRLLRTRSLEVLSHLAAGAAHEMNNPLAVISGRAQLLLGQEGLDAFARKSIDAIRTESQRCSAIISELMSVAKPAAPSPVAFSIRGILESARSRALLDFGLNLDQFELSLDDEALAVFADPAQISTALDALIRNALEAGTPQSIKVSINSASRHTDDPCVIVLQDNGRGMTPEALASALDPFFSNRQAGRGRGLGLSRALRLVERNRGRLDIESSPGRGTRVILSLPTRPA